MEHLIDLLVPRKNRVDEPAVELQIKEDPVGGIFVKDLTQRPITSAVDMLTLLDEGGGRRTVASTNMNSESSRSHAVLTLTLAQVNKGDALQMVGEINRDFDEL